ncbi:MAG: putative lipoprotein, partial [Cellvibrio sp.]|nr:putative lipoprotein [Cellvibrio sp.]
MIMSKASTLSNAIFWRDTPHDWLEPTIDGNWDVFSPRLHLDRERELTNKPADLLDHLNLIVMAGQMSQPMYDLILDHLNNNKVDPTWGETGQMWQRDMLVYEALFLVMASPEYAVQR